MTYRDETTALRERNAALEAELADKSRALALYASPEAPPALPTRNLRSQRVAVALLVAGALPFLLAVLIGALTTVRPPYDVIFPIAGASSLVIVSLGFLALVLSRWFVAPTGRALLTSVGQGFFVTFPGQGRFVWPLSTVRVVSIEPRSAQSTIECRLKDDARATIRATVVVAPVETRDGVERFARRWSPAQEREIAPFVQTIVDGVAREVFAHFVAREVDAERSRINDEIESRMRDDLERAALSISHCAFTVERIEVASPA
ncbi:MAG: hypothetical protein JNK05_03910 [Myxococcales bacterium]|nr:hypothetical protein [Myxococcales bacterium]